MTPLAARIDAALPQTQCTRCGYPDCAGYAQAIATGEADIHQCPPGGAEGIARLARITGRPAQPLGAEFGIEGPRMMAVIDEAWCIGCTLCLDACPTDAIVGINKRMHTVIEPHCTGCELCIPVCPVDCISLEEATPGKTGWLAWSDEQANAARMRYAAHRARTAACDAAGESTRDSTSEPADQVEAKTAAQQAAAPQATAPSEPSGSNSSDARKRAFVEAALAKARERQLASSSKPRP